MDGLVLPFLQYRGDKSALRMGKSVIIFFLAAVKQIREQKEPTFTINLSVPIILCTLLVYANVKAEPK